MEVSKEQSSLHDERGKTDSSLVSERGKTDDSFAKHRKKTESDTDKQIEAGRQDADDVRAQARKSADAKTALGKSGLNQNNQIQTSIEILTEKTLQTQRIRDDEAVDFERTLMDAALIRERESKEKEANKFFKQEREETDKNLSRERSHTDSEVLRTSDLLSNEMISHKATKAELTSRDEFLAIVSHDLRNPIGAILSYSDLLLEDGNLSGDDAKKWAQVIKRNAENSLRLISDILDMERFAEGKLQLNFAPTNIDKLINETVESFKYTAAEKNISLRSVPSGAIRLINFDQDRIAQALANLLGNAIKFTPENGLITVAAHESADNLKVSVSDNGVGIPAGQQNRIFERFAQLENKNRVGLGLGLYISKMLIEAHQGNLVVDSEIGKGTIFTFTIPYSRID